MAKKSTFTDEVEALAVILEALNNLDEEKREFVYRTAGERFGIRVSKGASRNDLSSRENDELDGDEISPKQFMHDKMPKTDVEKIACIAFYLTHYRDTPIFKTKEVTDLSREAAQPKMSNPSQAMKNATYLSHFLASAEKGAKQITALGEESSTGASRSRRSRERLGQKFKTCTAQKACVEKTDYGKSNKTQGKKIVMRAHG